jgi:hypothetical protein
MKLFTKDIDKKLFQQYQNGSDLDSQVAVAKIFNPYGNGRWFLLNSDPQDPDYLWAIVQMGDIVEVGSVLRSELESVRVSPFKFPLERDLGFTMVNAGELYRGLQEGKFYEKGGSLMASRGMEVGRYYQDKNGDSYRYIGENSQRQTLFNDGQNVIVKSIDDFEEKPTEKKLFGFFENGGETEDDGVDLFEDYENIPHNVQVILVKYTDAFEDGSYNALAKAKKELEDIGYTFEYGLGGGAYDLRKLGQKGKNEDDYADGGFVDKTDEELKGMTDDELFEYLDAKAAYMKQYARPLSSFKAKNFAANAAAVQFKNEGTSKLDANFPSLSKINQQATKDYEETIAKRNKMASGGFTSSFSGTPDRRRVTKEKGGMVEIGSEGMYRGGAAKVLKYDDKNKMYAIKYLNKDGKVEGDFVMARKETFENGFADFDPKMAKGGMMEHGLRIGDKVTTDMFWDNKIVVENVKTRKRAEIDLDNGKRKDEMAMGGKVKFQDKVKAIKASLLKTKKVPKKVQKDYGKTYNAKEAELAAKRIAGAMAKKGMK